MPLPLGRYYGGYSGNLVLGLGDYLLESSQDNITATAGGGQANAFQVQSQTVRVTTVATAGDSIMLPPSTAGLELLVFNHGANSMQVFGNLMASDLIDDQLGTIGVAQMANSVVIYSCASAGNWYSEGLATGYSKGTGLQTISYATITTTGANLIQSNGAPIKSMLNNVITGASAQAITLPVSAPGLCIVVHTITPGNTLLVWPNAGGTGTEAINAIAANGSLTMGALTSATFTCAVSGQWYTVPRVPT